MQDTNADDNRLVLSAYLDSLQHQRMLSPHTISNYARDLQELLSLCHSMAIDMYAVKHVQIRKFAAQLHAKGLNARSIARKLSAWRGFYDWLSEQRDLPSNPVDGVKAPKKTKPLPKALAADDAVHLVSHGNPLKAEDETLQRCNRAMFELLYSSGLRVSELVGLDVRFHQENNYSSLGWIDLDNHEVTVTGKGSKMRSVPVGQAAIDAIKQWLEGRASILARHADGDPHALFLSERGTRMSVRVAQLRLKAHAQALGMATNVHPHVLRHSFASHLLQGSGDLRAVQELLGHASITATQVYTSLDFQRLAQVYDAAHPRAKKVPPK
ncbi:MULTISPECIES: tyrosine recombinase XerC [unclassified Herbaspirillum]|uniref:tyrosine recombinase XerC n=1 Tax=unclassified Herbaspirillum TaxID=2624150 RepID=UPI00161878DB|nr:MULTISPECIES: tyrosine recombinase XerC [unclassified Herbaspirillum]